MGFKETGGYMFSRMVSSLVLLAAAFSLSAHADGKRYLVQFKSSQAFKAAVQSMKAQAFSADGAAVELMNTKARVNQALESIEMLVVESSDARAIESLKRHPAIALVEEEIFHPAPKPMATWGHPARGALLKKSKMARPWGIDAVKAPGAWNTTKGEAARVMVLDTGVDANHVDLKSRFEKAQNFTTSNINDYVDTIGHGSHVAGTILADGSALIGVAPKAKLLMGKVCSEVGCGSVGIAAGINWAIQEKVDVVNMSLGGMFISNAEAQALRAAEAAGVMVIAASGNGGTANVSYPAAFETVMAVGAIDSTMKKADFSQWGPQLAIMGPGVDVVSSVPSGTGRGATAAIDMGDGKGLNDIKALPFVGSPLAEKVENELVFAGLGKPGDFTNVNVRGKFALISRGEIPFVDKVKNAIQAGATGVVIFNNVPGLIQGALTEDGSEGLTAAAMIEQTVGDAAKAALATGRSVRVSLSIDATDYASFQGTSMATPHVAGVAALVRAANKSLTPAQVREILKATAVPLGPNNENQYGSGLVDAAAAVARAQSFTGVELRQVAN